MQPEGLDLTEYTYELPDEKIARYPLKNRAQSKLLSYKKGVISHTTFQEIPQLLPKNAHLVFNDTRVIPARLIFYKETGARVEVFLLSPIAPSQAYDAVMASQGFCSWNVMIGNSRKWKIDTSIILQDQNMKLEAHRKGESIVTFRWDTSESFSEILARAGTIPLPPYLGRASSEVDLAGYQTVYSRHEGAVAAPTAGLHFTPGILTAINQRAVSTDFLTLHVSAGTFQPIKAQSVQDHPMHREQIIVRKQNIEKLLAGENIIAVGTTSMRTIESLYWFGCKLANDPDATFLIEKLAPYQAPVSLSKEESLDIVLKHLQRRNLETITGHTEIFIFPGYEFRICRGLITNFHLPSSTLILLVAAFIGNDWRQVYEQALSHDYRFLSYGDSSLLLP